MANKKGRHVNAFLRDVIAPLVCPDGMTEKDNQLYGKCPNCGRTGEHWSIAIIDGNIGGSCVACGYKLSDEKEKNPDLANQINGYKKFIDDNERSEKTPDREHFYTNSVGKHLYVKQIFKTRAGKKRATWKTVQPDGMTFVYNIPKGEHPPIYRLHEVVKAETEMPDAWVNLTEGEKDADNLVALLRSPSTCFPNGSNSLKKRPVPTDWVTPFKGRKVVIFGDNDDEGIHAVEAATKLLFPIADAVKVIMPTDLLSLPYSEIVAKKKGYDVSDYIEEVGTEVAYQKITKLIEEKPVVTAADVAPDPNQPTWLYESTYNGRTTRKIDEPQFCKAFIEKYKVVRINGLFYVDGESVSNDYIMNLIQSWIAPYFIEKTGRLTQNVYYTLCNSAFTEQPEPDERKIFCKGHTTLSLDAVGNVTATKEDVFTLTRLAVKYNPKADCPTFKKYLRELLFDEDIPTVQEFMGYCLIPSTRAQAGLFIHGKGGEGKSVLRDVVMTMFGKSAVQESVDQLGARFVMANLENKLVSVDDDMQTALLSETNTLKKLITARLPFQVERKNKDKYDALLFTRVFAIGNSFIGSKFDHSDGFYRRQLMIDCRPKRRPESEDDRFMSDKVVAEIEGILVWSLEGLQRLMKNNFHFTRSERMLRTIEEVKHDGDNVAMFLDDDMTITTTDSFSDQITSADLFKAYCLFCYDNSETPVKRKSFGKRVAERFGLFRTRIRTDEGRLNAYTNVALSAAMANRLKHLDQLTAERISRLP